jgi:hypothetical protein
VKGLPRFRPLSADEVRAIAEDFPMFCSVLGIALYPWQADAFGLALRREDGRFVHHLAGVSAPRGNGKSWSAALGALWRFRFGPPPQTILSVGLLVEGARIILDHARRLLRQHPVLAEGIEERADGFLLTSTGSRWIVRSREHESSRGEHPDLVTYDEIGWASDDELFSSLLAAQASVVDPLMLVVSTVGRRKSGPLWRVKEISEASTPEVLWWHTAENGSPRVTPAFLERQRRLLLPAQYAREHENTWVDSADSFTDQSSVDAAMAFPVEPAVGVSHVMAVDIGSVHDPSVVGVGHRQEDGVLVVDQLRTLQGSKESPVSMAALEQVILDLARAYEPVSRIRIESWQGIASAQRLTALGLPVELFVPTAKVLRDMTKRGNLDRLISGV